MPERNFISMALQDSIKLPLDNAYVQLTQYLRVECIPEIYLPRHSTQAVVDEVTVMNLEGDRTSVWFRPHLKKSKQSWTDETTARIYHRQALHVQILVIPYPSGLKALPPLYLFNFEIRKKNPLYRKN